MKWSMVVAIGVCLSGCSMEGAESNTTASFAQEGTDPVYVRGVHPGPALSMVKADFENELKRWSGMWIRLFNGYSANIYVNELQVSVEKDDLAPTVRSLWIDQTMLAAIVVRFHIEDNSVEIDSFAFDPSIQADVRLAVYKFKSQLKKLIKLVAQEAEKDHPDFKMIWAKDVIYHENVLADLGFKEIGDRWVVNDLSILSQSADKPCER